MMKIRLFSKESSNWMAGLWDVFGFTNVANFSLLGIAFMLFKKCTSGSLRFGSDIFNVQFLAFWIVACVVHLLKL